MNTYGWDPAAPEKKGAQRLGVNYNSASFSITDPEMPLQPLHINQDNHIALLDKATGSTNTMHSDGRTEKARDRQTPKHCREGQEKSGLSDTKGSSAAAPGASCHDTFPFPVHAATG